MTERDSHRFRSWCFLIQNVYRRSLSSDPDLRKLKGFHDRDPQGLRRPRFSFFIFTCQTARGRNPSPYLKGAFSASHSTANGNRIYRLFLHSSKMRSLAGAKTRLGQGPKQRRAQWPGYRPARSWLSTAIVNKSSHRFIFFATRRSPNFFRTMRRTRATILRRSGILK